MNSEVKIDGEIKEVVDVLGEIINDDATNKNVKESLSKVIGILKQKEERLVKVHNALQELEDIAENKNMESFTRSAIFNIVSMLESLGN